MLQQGRERHAAVLGAHGVRELGEDLRQRAVPGETTGLDLHGEQVRGHGLHVRAQVEAIGERHGAGRAELAHAEGCDPGDRIAAHHRAGDGRQVVRHEGAVQDPGEGVVHRCRGGSVPVT